MQRPRAALLQPGKAARQALRSGRREPPARAWAIHPSSLPLRPPKRVSRAKGLRVELADFAALARLDWEPAKSVRAARVRQAQTQSPPVHRRRARPERAQRAATIVAWPLRSPPDARQARTGRRAERKERLSSDWRRPSDSVPQDCEARPGSHFPPAAMPSISTAGFPIAAVSAPGPARARRSMRHGPARRTKLSAR